MNSNCRYDPLPHFCTSELQVCFFIEVMPGKLGAHLLVESIARKGYYKSCRVEGRGRQVSAMAMPRLRPLFQTFARNTRIVRLRTIYFADAARRVPSIGPKKVLR